MNTIGIVRVAACKALVSRRPKHAMTAGASATSSHARLGNRSGPALGIARLDKDVLAINVAELFERPAKRGESVCFDARAGPHQDADARYPCPVLRHSDNRPDKRGAAEHGEKPALSHLMISLAPRRGIAHPVPGLYYASPTPCQLRAA